MQRRATSEVWLAGKERRRLPLCACAGFFLSPGAWLLQVIVSETISARACSNSTLPPPQSGVSHLHAWLYGTSIVAMLISVISAGMATFGFVFLQRLQRRMGADADSEASHAQPTREREEVTRKRFIALCSALIGCGFVIGLVFTIQAEVFFLSCSPWH